MEKYKYLHSWEMKAAKKNDQAEKIASQLDFLRGHQNEILPKTYCRTEERLLLDLFKLAYR